MDIQKPRERTK